MSCVGPSLQVTVTLALAIFVNGVAIDNEITAAPQVECTQNGIRLRVPTRNPFLGRIFVKGESETPECSTGTAGPQNYRDASGDSTFSLSFDRCGMYRLRMLNPRGMMYTTTIVVSFHPIFITKVDRAYKVSCFYGEIDKTVHAALNVSMIPTTDLTDDSQMPKCYYSLRRENVDGPPMQFARVGDSVAHRWECDSDDMYKFLVRDCYVEDGHGKRIEVVDSNGCTTDPVLLSDLTYESDRPIAFAESHVFKFADVTQLYFQCQMQICLKMEEGCSELTPPRCTSEYHGPVDRHRQRVERSVNATAAVDRQRSDELDVRGQISVFDIDEAVDKLLTEHHNHAQAAGSMLYEFTQPNGEGVQPTCSRLSKSDLLMVTSSLAFILFVLMAILTIVVRRTNTIKPIRY